MPVTPARRRVLAAAVAAIALLSLPAPASAVAPPYVITDPVANTLEVQPAAGGTTLALKVSQSGPGPVTFEPAAAVAPAACTTDILLGTTTCPALSAATRLNIHAPVLEAHVLGVDTDRLILAGGGESDLFEVEGPVATNIDLLTVVAGAGDDAIVVRGRVSAIDDAPPLPLPAAPPNTGADRYDIQSPTISGTLRPGEGNDFVATVSASLNFVDAGPGTDTLIGATTLNGGADDDVLKPTRANLAQTVDGGPGTDRVSYELIGAPLRLVVTGTSVSVNNALGNAFGVEHVHGGSGPDEMIGTAAQNVLIGGDGDDTIEGRGGSDQLDGGPGYNTVTYASAPGPVVVSLGGATGAGTGSAFGGVDTLRSFRGVVTGASNDVVTGASAPEQFVLGAGDDVADAGAGDDVVVDAGPGSDVLRGGPGNDILRGGAGRDTATYSERGPSEPLNVTLATPGGDGGAGESDTLEGIEDVVGGDSNDILTGDPGPNSLSGGAGVNTLDGGAGDDVVRGGDARDVITGGPGRDQLFGEGDDDSLNAFDREIDIMVDCGASADDDAQVDSEDPVAGCEFPNRADVPVPVDADGDGFVAGLDCNDGDRTINPGAVDVPEDGIDQDCDTFDQLIPYVDFGLEASPRGPTKREVKLKRTGRRFKTLVVNDLAAGTRVQISCTTKKRVPKRCPITRRTFSPNAKTGEVRLTALLRNRLLPVGTTVELLITAPGFNGKVRRFRITAGGVRVDALCLPLGRRTPGKCPAGED